MSEKRPEQEPQFDSDPCMDWASYTDVLEAEIATLKRENRQLWDRLTVIEGFLRLKDLDLPGWSTDALLQESGF